jgi:hypothetical protein
LTFGKEKMLFPIIIAGLLGIYLAIEERERSAANPNSEGWWRRVRRSGRRKVWIVVGTLLGGGIQLARKQDFQETLALGGVALFLIVFFILQEATLELPRKDKKE